MQELCLHSPFSRTHRCWKTTEGAFQLYRIVQGSFSRLPASKKWRGAGFCLPPASQAWLGLQLDNRPHVHLNTRRQLSEIGILGQCIIGRLNG